MAVVLVLAPMSVELTPVVHGLHLRRDLASATHVGRVGEHRVVARRAGVGPRRAASVTRLCLCEHRADHVVVAGVAGGLSPETAVGDLVVPAVVSSLGGGPEHHAAAMGPIRPEGHMVTAADLLAWQHLQSEAEAGVLAVDMETDAIAAECEAAGVPWTALRGISDLVRDETVGPDSLDLVREDGRTALMAVARRLRADPRAAAAMAEAGKGTAAAMAAAVRALRSALAGPLG